MAVNFNVNAGVTDLVKFVAGQVTRYTEEDRKRKIFAMAKDCAKRLKLPDWDIVTWPHQAITSDLLDVIASSEECVSDASMALVARQLSNYCSTENRMCEFFANKLGIASTNQFWNVDGTVDALSFCWECLHKLVAHQNTAKLASSVAHQVLSQKNGGSLSPLWSFSDLGWDQLPEKSCTRWSRAILDMYRVKWKAAVLKLRPVNTRTSSLNRNPALIHFAVRLLDIIVTIDTSEALSLGPKINVSTECEENYWKDRKEPEWLRGEEPEWLRDSDDKTVYFVFCQVVYRFLTSVLINEYATYLLYCMREGRKKGRVKTTTNRTQLRMKHLSNKDLDSATNKEEDFFLLLPHLELGASSVLFTTDTSNYDLLACMARVLGAEECFLPSIQLSVLERELKLTSFRNNSFLGKLNRRKVGLLKCGNDRALIIPYLNKILLDLRDERWVRDDDVLAHQPFSGKYDEGAVRRAANIMLALSYPKEGSAFVNKIAYDLILSYAKKGELYSAELRDHLLSVLWMEHRVCIRALTVSARQVFDDNGLMAAALVREMIHDRLEMKSGFGSESESNENDAYYDAVYVRSGHSVSNNVWWSTGVPLFGIECCSGTYNHLRSYDPDVQMTGGRAVLGRTWCSFGRSLIVYFWVPVNTQSVAYVDLASDDDASDNRSIDDYDTSDNLSIDDYEYDMLGSIDEHFPYQIAQPVIDSRSIFLDDVFVDRYFPAAQAIGFAIKDVNKTNRKKKTITQGSSSLSERLKKQREEESRKKARNNRLLGFKSGWGIW